MSLAYGSDTRLKRVGFSLVLALLSVNCTLSVDADREQCKTNNDCQKRGSAFKGSVCQNSVCVVPEAWSCLFTPEAVESNESDGPFTVKIPLVSVLTQKPVPDVTARICAKIDAECLSPLGKEVISDAKGVLTLEVDAGFDGFITLTHVDFGTSLYFFNPAVTKDQEISAVRLASSEIAAMLMQQVGATYDPARGSIVLTADDCQGLPGDGISYSANQSDDRLTAFYSMDGLPTTQTNATDPSGYGGFIDVAPGNLTITGSHGDYGTVGKLTLFVKSNTTSYSRMVPHAQP